MYCVKCKKATDTSNVQFTVSKIKKKHETRNVCSMWNDQNPVYQSTKGWMIVK